MADTTDGMFVLIDGPIGGVDDNGDTLLTKIQKFQQAAEDKIETSAALGLSADATAVSSNTLTGQSGLLQNVASSVVYSFKIVLWITATAGEGLQIDLNGGSITATWIKASFKGYDNASPGSLALVGQSSALATAVGPQDAFSGHIVIEGSLQPSSTGTFGVRIAQTAHSAGSVQVLKGSTSLVQATA